MEPRRVASLLLSRKKKLTDRLNLSILVPAAWQLPFHRKISNFLTLTSHPRILLPKLLQLLQFLWRYPHHHHHLHLHLPPVPLLLPHLHLLPHLICHRDLHYARRGGTKPTRRPISSYSGNPKPRQEDPRRHLPSSTSSSSSP
jgi:hypothetical protein